MTAYTAVLLYAGWMLILALIYAFPRVPQALTGAKPIDSWERNKQPIDPPILQRAKAAHLNCIENFAVFAAVVVVAGLMDRLEAVNALAAYVLYARLAQSLVHISGTSFVQILLRATFFLIQIVLVLMMVYQLLLG
ncbi:MAPEG family protein [Marinobacter sp.]|uniref:MAPEG family protein n=1 Tax=Marinobacter sp. TaxID=50741 RepID=UPI0034A2B5A0